MEAQLIFLNILLEDKSYLAEPLHIMNILVLLELGHWARINVNCMIDGLQLEDNMIRMELQFIRGIILLLLVQLLEA